MAELQVVRPRPKGWNEELEDSFQNWYARWAEELGLDPNPDHPLQKYDYRAAYLGGAYPTLDAKDNRYHWPSEYKDEDHPTRYKMIRGAVVDTRKGRPVIDRIGAI